MNEEEKALGVMATSAIAILPWEVYTNEATNRKGAGISNVLITPKKLVMEKSLQLSFLATNNEVKYEALLAGVAIINQLGGEVVKLYFDSRLVVGQVNGEFEARDERMQGYHDKVKQAWA